MNTQQKKQVLAALRQANDLLRSAAQHEDFSAYVGRDRLMEAGRETTKAIDAMVEATKPRSLTAIAREWKEANR